MDASEFNGRIFEIANDRTSGASYLAKSALECLDQFAGWVFYKKSELSPGDYLKELIKVGKNLVQAQPTMASIIRAINEVIICTKEQLILLKDEIGPDLTRQLKYLCTFTQSCARKCILESDLALETISREYPEILEPGESVMTISASSAVERILMEAKKDSFDLTVYIPESRPMYEGRMMAQRLARAGLKINLIADSAMFHFLDDCNSILIGADRVLPGGVVNKIGTYGLAIASKKSDKPFYCVCECNKFIPDIIPLNKLIVNHPPEQLLEKSDGTTNFDNLTIRNIYFDFTPIEYVTRFLTEDGIMTATQVKEYINSIEILPELITDFK